MNRTILIVGVALLMLGVPATAKNAVVENEKVDLGEDLGISNASCPLGAGVNSLAIGASVTSSLPNVIGASCEFSIAAPAQDAIIVTLSGLQSDFDLYTKLNGIPTTSSWNCRPYSGGTTVETCTTMVNAGDFVGAMVRRYTGSGSFTLSVTVPTPLENGVPAEVTLAATGRTALFKLVVPAGSTLANFALAPADDVNAAPTACHVAGLPPCVPDADLYVRRGAIPTTSLFDCRPYTTGNTEACTFESNSFGALGADATGTGISELNAFGGAGTYFVMLRSYSGAPHVQLQGVTA